MLILHDEFNAKLKEITELSNKINKNNNYKILEMMKVHIEEIEERYLSRVHFLIAPPLVS